MTNYEKHKAKIDEIWETRDTVALCNGEVRSCYDVKCSECGFYAGGYCSVQMARWLVAEYKEPQIDWSKVLIDTPILVRSENTEWLKRHFAKYEDGRVYTWECGRTSWTAYSEYDVYDWDFAKLVEE